LSPRKRIVFPEGEDPRVREAARRLAGRGLLDPVLIARAGHGEEPGIAQVDPAASDRRGAYAGLYLERRRARGATEREAQAAAARPLDFAALMVAAGDADGSVGGAANSTAETVRAALYAIGPATGIRTVSSFFVLGVPEEREGCGGLFVAADCAVLIQPDAEQLADIARMAARSARMAFECEPVIGLLPGNDAALSQRVRELLVKSDPELQVRTGEDAFRGVNALVFPDLHAANIGYKLVEWLGGGAAFGPMLQGLARPANDLSRACTPDDIYSVALITALQAHSVVAA
jgi:phosphate acetyltransferase